MADLTVKPKPVPSADIVTSDEAANQHDADIESWGEAGWLQVSRICRWARSLGMKDAPCKP